MSPVPTVAHMTAESDRIATSAMLGGDEDAFVALAEECHPIMMRLACALTTDIGSAQDLVRSAWLDVLAELDGFTGATTLRAWTVRRVTNRAGREGLPPLASGSSPRIARRRAAPHDGWDRPIDVLRELVRSAIDRLPPAERVVVTLKDVEGWSSTETSAALGLSDEKTLRLLHRARMSLNEAIEASPRRHRARVASPRAYEPIPA